MAQPAVSSSEDRTKLLGVPSFWGKPSAEPLYPWEVWIGQFFLAVSLKENCDPNILLPEPAKVHDDPPPRPEQILNSETAEEADSRTARNEAAIRKTNEANEERTNKGPKISPNVYYHEADARFKSRLFFALGNEGKKRFLQQHAHINLNTVKFKFFHDACEQLFKREKNYIIERMQMYNASHGDKESLESFYLRLAGQASTCVWTEEIEKVVIRDIFIAKMRFSDILRELCIRPGATVDDTLKSALLQEKGYVTASTLQRQNPSTMSNSANFTNSSNQFRVKQEPLMSIQSKNNVQNRMNRALGKGNFKPKNQQDQSNTQSKPCYFWGEDSHLSQI